LYLSLGEHVEAGRIFEALLNQNFEACAQGLVLLGQGLVQRGYLGESERALRQVSDKIDPRISAERYMLLAQLMMRQNRYDDAITALRSWHGAPTDRLRSVQLGVALCAVTGLRTPSPTWTAVGASRTRSEELVAQDKANLALGSRCCSAARGGSQTHPAAVRLQVLLEQGAARPSVGRTPGSEIQRALVPWPLGKRTCSIPRCRDPSRALRLNQCRRRRP